MSIKKISANVVNVICMKWGDKFGPEYVNRLYGMVARNLTLDFRFICFTEVPKGIRPEVEIQPLPELDIPEGLPERGWMKLTLYAENFGNLSGPTLFLDLDVVIVGSIDCLFEYEAEFAIVHDKHRPARMIGNSSVFRFEIGRYPHILKNFTDNFIEIRKQFRHEQAYLSSEIRKLGILKFWPDEWCPSFKYHCVPPWPKSWYQTPRIPENSRVIIFHGVPNPPDALIGESGKWWRLIRPSPWLEKYWTE